MILEISAGLGAAVALGFSLSIIFGGLAIRAAILFTVIAISNWITPKEILCGVECRGINERPKKPLFSSVLNYLRGIDADEWYLIVCCAVAGVAAAVLISILLMEAVAR